MAQVRTQVEQVLRQIDRMTEGQQCELLEAMLLKQRRSDLGWGTIKRIRATLPRRSEQQVKSSYTRRSTLSWQNRRNTSHSSFFFASSFVIPNSLFDRIAPHRC